MNLYFQARGQFFQLNHLYQDELSWAGFTGQIRAGPRQFRNNGMFPQQEDLDFHKNHLFF